MGTYTAFVFIFLPFRLPRVFDFSSMSLLLWNWADVSTAPPSSSGLIPYGLAPDKLSKWTDLVAIRQAKRIRKNGEEAISSSVNDL